MDAARESRKRRISEASDVLRDGSISPPPKRNASAENGHFQTHVSSDTNAVKGKATLASDKGNVERPKPKVVPSPVQLNFIEELPAISNVNTISLGSILDDPMIKECWLFNYLFDMDYIMKHFDPDTRELVQVKVVHGSWKREDMNGIAIEEAAKRYNNIQIIKAYMPEMYGTHHSKMIVLFRHDDLAQVILLTANFIERDWRMSQAIWKTPLLRLQRPILTPTDSLPLPPLGSGPRFKHDLLAYYLGYGATKLQSLISQLQQYDFSEVRGALIASIPGRHPIHALDTENSPLWGWPALKHILSCIPSTNIPPPPSNPSNQNQPQIILQISSIASLGENWLSKTFLPALSTTLPTHSPSPQPKFSIIFPTPSEIRNSIDGYASGSSIHMKISSPAQAKQLTALKPMLCHWGASDQSSPATLTPESILHAFHGQGKEQGPKTTPHPPPPAIRTANRAKAAPHIKTYIRFTSPSYEKIDWAILTSANLSTQAWGAAPTASSNGREVRICSYEIGVVVWPGLWDEGEGAEMVPIFIGGDDDDDDDDVTGGEEEKEGGVDKNRKGVRVCWRMPYDLPLVPYGDDEMPWSAEVPCRVPDRLGRRWLGYGS